MRKLNVALLLTLLFSTAAHAVTYIVPADREMIQGSDDIVIATGVTSTVIRTARGGIVTQYTLRVEETFKGRREPGQFLVLTELGGKIGDTFIYSPGTPEYEPGQRYMVFTETDSDGEPITYGLSLGQFKLMDDHGRLVAVRDGIAGVNQNLESHVERLRDARRFIEYIRGIVSRTGSMESDYFVTRVSPATNASSRWVPKSLFTRASYLTSNLRWPTPTYSFILSGAQPGADGPGSVGTAASLWSGTASVISMGVGPQNDLETCSLCDSSFDGENVVQFNRPGLPAGVAGRAHFGGGGTHTVPGDPATFNNITECDVHIDDVSFSQCLLDIVVTHEVGHTLGFRHSDQPPVGGESTTNAFMNSIVSCSLFGSGSLKQYDEDAASTVYGSGPVCTPPGISVQPANKTITPPATSTSLSVTATGSSPFSYQWYEGNAGDTSTPTGTNSSSITVSPIATTNYWVRITGQCAPTKDSNTAIVTVAPCAPPVISSQSNNTSIIEGTSTQLTVNATGTSLHYQWYVGSPGNTSQPTGTDNKNLAVSPTTTTTYWVRVTGACEPADDSAGIVVTVEPCGEVIIGTPTATISGASAILNITASSTASGALSYAWFRGNTPGGVGTQVGSTKSVTVAVTADARNYWVRVTNSCNGVAISGLVAVASCTLPVIQTQPADQSILTGTSTNVSLALPANATGITVTWYRGTAPDKTNQIGTGTSVPVGPLTATTSYWASLRNTCGEISSRTAVITVTAPTCTGPTITTAPLTQQVPINTPATLLVVADGTATLLYQWYEGAKSDTTKPIESATLPTFVSRKILSATSFWVRVTNGCGTIDSEAAVITVPPGRRRAAAHR